MIVVNYQDVSPWVMYALATIALALSALAVWSEFRR